MSKCDRLDMLTRLSMFDKYNDMSVFESYILNHYAEIYSLYTLLEKSNISYPDIKFREPLSRGDEFVIRCKCQDDVIRKLEMFLEENKTIKYLRKNSFVVNLSYDKVKDGFSDVEISFNKI